MGDCRPTTSSERLCVSTHIRVSPAPDGFFFVRGARSPPVDLAKWCCNRCEPGLDSCLRCAQCNAECIDDGKGLSRTFDLAFIGIVHEGTCPTLALTRLAPGQRPRSQRCDLPSSRCSYTRTVAGKEVGLCCCVSQDSGCCAGQGARGSIEGAQQTLHVPSWPAGCQHWGSWPGE